MSLFLMILLGLGLVLVIEGLVFIFAPARLDELLRLLAELPPETRRMIGFGALAIGAILVSFVISRGGP